jgi:hypothetical protein
VCVLLTIARFSDERRQLLIDWAVFVGGVMRACCAHEGSRNGCTRHPRPCKPAYTHVRSGPRADIHAKECL